MVNPFQPESEPALLGDAAAGTVMLVEGSSFVVSARSGDIVPPGPHGLFVRSRRALSRWELRVDGRPLLPLSAEPVTSSSATVVARTPADPGHAASELLVVLRRRVADGMSDELTVRHYGPVPRDLTVSLDAGSDFADIFAVKEGRPVPVTGVARAARPADGVDGLARLVLDWAEGAESRATTVSVQVVAGGGVVDVAAERRRLTWSGSVPARGEVVLHLLARVSVAGRLLPDAPDRTAAPEPDSAGGRAVAWRRGVPVLATPDWRLQRAWDQALDDVAALRMPAPRAAGSDVDRLDPSAGRPVGRDANGDPAPCTSAAGRDADPPARPVVAAGAPWFMALFGRDSLITSWFALMADPDLAFGVLDALARLQGRHEVDETEEQPGRVMHEMRPGGLLGSHVYYGTADATPLFVMLLGEAAEWGLPLADVRRLLPHADQALRWVTDYGDRDRDGFVEYRRLHPDGLANQGWKDSHDAIRFADGRLASAPIALAEVQAYVYGAYQARARLATMLGDDSGASTWSQLAQRLSEAFDQAFWIEREGRYALALDAGKDQVDAPVSNSGHCLWAGIVPPDRAERVADSLLAEDLWTGFGVRTMGRSAAGYNPMSYHCGSVWPHDSVVAAAGLARYGFHDRARQVVEGLLDLAAANRGRLPELVCGLDRSDVPAPVPYPTSCSPQAWAAASPLMAVRTLLGLRPDAVRRVLHLRPPLGGMRPLRVTRMPLAGARVDLMVSTEGRIDVTGLPPGWQVALHE